ncbi:unnamed protein product [Prorocentrum cordatum]|uniref:RAP domain-containing protein n=1 Tax=Prorocentrum cordatum TaxID=2364126 RepID=A0ABN9TEQ7_9DINO|nr:unnamed protein product [Polarella glacialis]
MVGWFESEDMDVGKRGTQNAVLQVVWSFAVAGFHTRYESFAAFLDYVFFAELADRRPLQLHRLAQLADMSLQEAPEVARLCQYPERLAAARTDPRVRSLVSAEPAAEPQLLQEVVAALRGMGRAHEVRKVPDGTSPFAPDVSLEEGGRKVGLLTAGQHELLRSGPPGTNFSGAAEAGAPALRRRLLRSRGWQTALVDAPSWAALRGGEEQQAHLERLLSAAAGEGAD